MVLCYYFGVVKKVTWERVCRYFFVIWSLISIQFLSCHHSLSLSGLAPAVGAAAERVWQNCLLDTQLAANLLSVMRHNPPPTTTAVYLSLSTRHPPPRNVRYRATPGSILLAPSAFFSRRANFITRSRFDARKRLLSCSQGFLSGYAFYIDAKQGRGWKIDPLFVRKKIVLIRSCHVFFFQIIGLSVFLYQLCFQIIEFLQ